MPPPGPPYLSCSRPALELLASLPQESAPLQFAAVARISRRPRTTVVRLLSELVGASLLLRVHRDLYRAPPSEVTAWLLAEPNAYLRSLYLRHTVYKGSGRRSWAFACVLVRPHLDFEIPEALPVMPPDRAELKGQAALPHPEALRYAFGGRMSRRVRWNQAALGSRPPPPGCETLPCLRPLESLALLAATADPRLVDAVTKAAERLKVDVSRVMLLARSMHPESPPIRVFRPNTVVYPRWLAQFGQTAAMLHSRRSIPVAESKQKPGRRPGRHG